MMKPSGSPISGHQDAPVDLLAVEDEPGSPSSIGRLLAGIEAKVLSVRRIEEARGSLDEAEFALILIDVRSLGAYGLEAARLIRGRNRSKGTPILFLAAGDGSPGFSVGDAYALGAVDCMVGPVDPEILRSKVRMFLDLFWRTRAAVHSAWDARERLEDVLSTVNDLFLILDRDLRYLYVNDRMIRSSGIPRERLVGRTLPEVFPDMTGSRLEHELRRSIAEQAPVRFEFYDASADRWYDNRTYPSGNGLVLVTTEITDAKRAEQATRRHVGMLDAVLSTSVDHIYLFDRGGRYVLTSEGAARFLGLSREEVAGKTWKELGLPADIMDPVDRQRERVLASGRSELHEVSYPGPGGLRHFEYFVTPVRDDRGENAWAVIVSRDITDRKRAQDELEEREERLRLAQSSANIGTWDWDLRTGDVTCSEAVFTLLDLDPTDASDDEPAWLGLIHPEDLAETLCRIDEAVTGGGEFSAEFRAARRDGTYRWIASKGTVYLGDDGKPARFLGVSSDVTERRRAEDRLRESEGRFRLTADHAPVLIWTSGPDKRCTWFNRPWLEFTGRTMAQELGDGWAEGVHPDDLARCLEVYTSHFNARAPFTMEYRLRHRSGEHRWVIDNGIPLYGAVGEFAGYIGSCFDIHDRKLGEERQRLLAEAGRILGSTLDYEVTLAQVSELLVPGLADWCGLDLLAEDGELRRLTVTHRDPSMVSLANEYRRRYPPRPEDRAGLMAVLRTGEPLLRPEITDEELVRGARDAEHLGLLRALGPRSLIIVPMIARGRTLGTLTLGVSESSRRFGQDDLQLAQELASRVALAVDNAKLFSEAELAARRREEALNLHRSVEEQLTILLEASGTLSASLELRSVLAAVLDLSSRLISAHAYAVWRYEASSGRWGIAHGSGLSSRYQEESIQVLAETPRMTDAPIVAEDVLATPALGDRERAYEREGIRSLLAVPLKVRGEVTGTLVFYYRSPHKFSEVDLRVATALSNLAASAIGTAELYGTLQVNNRRKDEFLAMLAHELRNPLSAISNAVQVARRTDDREGREWSQEVIDRQVRHLSRLMDDLLDVSRITRGKITLKRTLLDAGPVLRTAAESVRPLVEERKHELTLDLPPGPLWVKADATRLEQIVMNLLTNAAKYTESGGRLALSARREGDQVLFVVRDNGVGIAPETLPEMFELFAQGDRTLARSEGGLGIGLTLVKSLAELHGGRVTARSPGPGKGSEFTVQLPVAAPAPEARGPAQSSAPVERPTRRVLVVDDNEDTARGMARLLKLLGHDVRTAHDGPAAVEAAQAQKPDYILLDIGLPGMSGYEVAKRLREDDQYRDTVIIAVSGYGQDEDRKKSKQAGIDHHFVKPVDHDALLKILVAR